MDGQDRQGASGLQRDHLDRDLPDRARARLGVFGEARQAEGHAGAVGNRPAHKLALGERAMMADGGEYNVLQIKESGGPVEIVYPTEGTPLVVGPNGLFKNAPNPNAARLFQCYCFTPECQQLIVDFGGLRSMHPLVKDQAGRKPFRDTKTMKEEPAGVERTSEEIKARYSTLFGV